MCPKGICISDTRFSEPRRQQGYEKSWGLRPMATVEECTSPSLAGSRLALGHRTVLRPDLIPGQCGSRSLRIAADTTGARWPLGRARYAHCTLPAPLGSVTDQLPRRRLDNHAAGKLIPLSQRAEQPVFSCVCSLCSMNPAEVVPPNPGNQDAAARARQQASSARDPARGGRLPARLRGLRRARPERALKRRGELGPARGPARSSPRAHERSAEAVERAGTAPPRRRTGRTRASCSSRRASPVSSPARQHASSPPRRLCAPSSLSTELFLGVAKRVTGAARRPCSC